MWRCIQVIKGKYILAFLLLIIPSLCLGADYYDWATRTDRDGKPAGIFTETPFPVVDGDTTYDITNDEGKTTYNLGTIVYVDNSGCGACADYSPIERDCGGAHADSDETNYTTITAAIAGVGNGNNTILVRAGTYSEYNMTPGTGTNNTNRFHIIGYNQERPIIDGGGHDTYDIFRASTVANKYVTLQRLKLQNSSRNGVRLGAVSPNKYDAYYNLIDIQTYNVLDSGHEGDAAIYALNADYLWVYHCTVERSYGHGIKIADDADNAKVEWNYVKEIGYWTGIGLTEYWGHHCCGLDFANSGTDHGDNHIVRYNIVHDTLLEGIQLRATPDFSVHHNEVYETCRCWDIMTDKEADCNVRSVGQVQTIIRGGDYGESDGSMYANVFRNPQDTAGPSDQSTQSHICIYTCDTNAPQIYIYNNLFFHHDFQSIWVATNQTGTDVFIYNNSFYSSNTDTLIDENISGEGASVTLNNNIFYQAGTGKCVELQAGTINDYNLYYYPSGSQGDNADGGNDIDATDPLWVQIPSGTYDKDDAMLSNTSPGKDVGVDLSGTFTDALNNTTRPQPLGGSYDMGCYEYITSDTTPPVISNIVPLPTVEYPSATTTVTITWDTDECAVCRIGEVDEADEDDLTNLATVETQGACGSGYGTSFSYDSTGLSPEDSKTFYIGGEDEAAANETTENAVSAFTIAAEPPPGDRMTVVWQ